MSIANLLAQTTKKDQNIFCDNLTTGSLSIDNLTTNDITANDITVNNDLTVNNNIIGLNNLTIENNLGMNSGDITLASGDITITSGNLDVVAGQVLGNLSTLQNSMSGFLVERGTHIWLSGQAQGVNELFIQNLDGNSDVFYDIEVAFQGEPTNNNNHLTLLFNGDIANVYSSRITQNTTGLKNLTNQIRWDFIDFESTNDKVGTGQFKIFASKELLGQTNIGMTGLYSSQTPGFNDTSNYKVAHTWNSQNSTNITSITIDVVNGNHTGWFLYYSIRRSN